MKIEKHIKGSEQRVENDPEEEGLRQMSQSEWR